MKTTKYYQPLFETITLPNGIELDNRFVLSPMITNASTSEGYVTEEDLTYAKRRARSAPLQITGAAYIEPYGQLFEYGFSIDKDESVPGLKKLAKAMKQDGAKAIIQLTHAGRFSKIALQNFGMLYGTSGMHLNRPFEQSVVTMSKEKIKLIAQFEHSVVQINKKKINQVITNYADATRRAIKAGFDGVEISIAQRLLIQTFLSTTSNKREDEYGRDSLENRSRFGIEVMTSVQKVIDEEAPKDFILGFRGTPEETRGNEIGYSVEDFLYFVDRIFDVANIQYIATASWGKNIYKQTIRQGNNKGEFMNKVVY